MSYFQKLNEEFEAFVREGMRHRGATERMHKAHALIRDALMRADFATDVWSSRESAWASACSERAIRSGRDTYASWRSYFLDRRAYERLVAQSSEPP